MKAAAAAQLRLLDLQAVDTTIAQLQHRRRTLPELTTIAERQKVRTRLGEELVGARTLASDLELEQQKAERDLEPVRERRVRDQRRLDGGQVSDPKALSALVAEIQHLGRRIGELEDAELEVMERLEEASAEVDRISAARSAVENELRTLIAKREAQYADIDADLAERQDERAGIAGEVPDDLIALYDKVRERSGGLGAAALERRRCSGCQLEANAAALTTYLEAAEDEVLRCEECNRILVRTPESGI